MRLYKKENSPYWWMDMKVNGRRIRKSTERLHKDKLGAQRVMALEYERLMNMGQLGDKPEITLSDAFDITLSEVRGQTQRIYRAAYGALRGTLGAEVRLSGISTGDVQKHVSKRRREGLKDNSLRSELKALRRVINRVAKSHRINPDIEWPDIAKFVKSRYLSDQEEAEVLRILAAEAPENITAEKAYALCIFLTDTGMRLMEAVDMEWAFIDMTGRTIEVYRSKTKSVSVVPMSERVHTVLSRYHNQPQPFLKMEWAIRHLRKVIDKVCNGNARINETRGRATIHSLRDTYATRMLRSGISIYKLAKLLGHTNAAMSEKYGHLEVADVVEEARKMLNDRAA